NDALGDRLLALVHEAIHEFGDDGIAELGVRQDLALDGGTTTRHGLALPLLRPLGAVFGPALAAVLDAFRVGRAADDVIAHAGEVLDAAAANEHHRVLLQIMALAGDVARDLEPVGQPHARHLAQRRVGLFRRRRIDARADAALLRRSRERRHLVAR